jgi:hypothetical protein
MNDKSEGEPKTETDKTDSGEAQEARTTEKEPKSPNPKDFWDKISSITPLLIGFFVTAVGTYLGQLHNLRQDKLAEVNALEKFQHLLESNDPVQREFGYASFAALGYEQLAIKLSSLTRDQAAKTILESIKQSNPSLASEAGAVLEKLNVDKNLISNLEGGSVSLSDPEIAREIAIDGPIVEKYADAVGVKSAIGKTVLFQSAIEWRPFFEKWGTAATNSSGGNPSTGVSEKLWLTAFLKERMNFIVQYLKDHSQLERFRNDWINQINILQAEVDKTS